MGKDPFVSIVMPIYNAEAFLAQCIESLLGQTFRDFELICVDDGSQDHSYEILREYGRLDTRIRVKRQANQNAGIARNNGMGGATGKYLLFLDSDDFFDKNLLKETVGKAEERETEVLLFDACAFDNESKGIDKAWTAIHCLPSEKLVFSSREIAQSIFNFTVPAPWNKLYLRSFIRSKGVQFQDIKSTNDLAFSYYSLACANRISLLSEKLVYYRVNNHNSLQGGNRRDPEDAFNALAHLNTILADGGMFRLFGQSYRRMASDMLLYTLGKIHSEALFASAVHTLRDSKLWDRPYTSFNSECGYMRADGMKVIYGAGAMAHVLVYCLVHLCYMDKGAIRVAVTRLGDHPKAIWDIQLQEINDPSINRRGATLIVAASNEANRKAMEQNAEREGFCNIVRILPQEVLQLLLKREGHRATKQPVPNREREGQ